MASSEPVRLMTKPRTTQFAACIINIPFPVPFSSTRLVPPSIVTAFWIENPEAMGIEETEKLIRSPPGPAFTSSIAARKLQTLKPVEHTPSPGWKSPEVLVELTVNVCAATVIAGAIGDSPPLLRITRSLNASIFRRIGSTATGSPSTSRVVTVFRVPTLVGSFVSEPRADRGPQAGSPLGVVDATGSVDCGFRIPDCGLSGDPVATARGTDTVVTARLE